MHGNRFVAKSGFMTQFLTYLVRNLVIKPDFATNLYIYAHANFQDEEFVIKTFKPKNCVPFDVQYYSSREPDFATNLYIYTHANFQDEETVIKTFKPKNGFPFEVQYYSRC